MAKLSDFKPAKYNPRKISDAALAALNKSIEQFGDLSGVVINKKTNTIIAGHQRLTTLKSKKTKVVTKKYKDEFGTVETGHIEVTKEDGSTFQVPLRIVNWDSRTEKLANIAANNHGGEFDNQKLGKLLAELKTEKFEIELAGFSQGEVDNLLRQHLEEKPDEKYTRKLDSPVYKVTGKKPKLSQIYSTERADELKKQINAAGLDKEITKFLLHAADRHIKFNFELIAEFYAHADKKTQALMEDCALVIVDYNKAIENGYLKLCDKIMETLDGQS